MQIALAINLYMYLHYFRHHIKPLVRYTPMKNSKLTNLHSKRLTKIWLSDCKSIHIILLKMSHEITKNTLNRIKIKIFFEFHVCLCIAFAEVVKSHITAFYIALHTIKVISNQPTPHLHRIKQPNLFSNTMLWVPSFS